MRELKFRVWDKPHNRLSRPFYVWQDLIEWDNNVPMPIQFTRKEGRFVWLQYTGLKDRNGKEIYEGDIVKYEDQIFEVIYYERWASFGFRYADSLEHYLVRTTDMPFEVIGNVYQNPELLEAEGVEE